MHLHHRVRVQCQTLLHVARLNFALHRRHEASVRPRKSLHAPFGPWKIALHQRPTASLLLPLQHASPLQPCFFLNMHRRRRQLLIVPPRPLVGRTKNGMKQWNPTRAPLGTNTWHDFKRKVILTLIPHCTPRLSP